MQRLRLRIAHAVTLLHTGGIAFVKHACRCLVRSARVNSGSDSESESVAGDDDIE